MLSFNQETKDKLIANLEAHAKADAFCQGVYFEDDKGCAVGCSLVDFGESPDDHSAYERLFGIPMAIAKIEDGIFEGLSVEDSKMWPLDFARAVPVNTDLSMVVPKFLVWLLGDVKKYASDDGKKAIQRVIDLYKMKIAGEAVSIDDWLVSRRAAADAAYAAADAAYDAAYAADAAADAYTDAYTDGQKARKGQADKLIEILKAEGESKKMTNWKPIETAPKDRPFLAREDDEIYKCRIEFYNEETGYASYESFCKQVFCYTPEPEEWCEIPD